jgi:hypothetical protein
MLTEYFKHAAHSPFFSFQNSVCFIILPFLVHVLFTFYIQGVLKFKNKFGSLRVNRSSKSNLKPVSQVKLSGAARCVTNCIFNRACRNIVTGYAGLLLLGRIASAEVGHLWKKAFIFCAKVIA